ncbi:hypothetical protein [Roseateles oligotrophus]|uniref:Lipoprotein n=1 Tax=Roseateles oligotrophus TaxID=1769250 RepID=A0ABT2YMU5_9BURK|nr:hypothetical protein [Roseateles oligotrophus]MCV2371387.1 hypothetical protein [Roseateles oligotrophus]
MNIRYFLLTISWVLTACAAPNISRDFSLEKSASAGVATGTITYDGDYAAYRLHLENKVSGQKFVVEHGSSQTLNLSLAFKGEDAHRTLGKKGSPFAIELPAGTYVVKSWQVSQGMANVWSTASTGIEFEVKPREAIYLGGFYFRETSRFGRAVTGSAVTLSDQSARDLPAIRSGFAALASVPLTQSLSTGAKLENVGGASNGKISIPIFIPVAR